MKTSIFTFSVPVEGGPLVFNVTPVQNVPIELVISNNDLKELNLQRWIIRGSVKTTQKEVRETEEKHQRMAKV